MSRENQIFEIEQNIYIYIYIYSRYKLYDIMSIIKNKIINIKSTCVALTNIFISYDIL